MVLEKEASIDLKKWTSGPEHDGAVEKCTAEMRRRFGHDLWILLHETSEGLRLQGCHQTIILADGINRCYTVTTTAERNKNGTFKGYNKTSITQGTRR